MQGTLERAIEAVTGESPSLAGSGRTDAGAHAAGQVVAFSTSSSLPPATLCRALNAHLPDDIAVTQVREVDPDFHPRYDALRRTYRYLIWNREVRSPFWIGRAAHIHYHLDAERMHRALQRVTGPIDVSSFVPARLTGNRVRTIFDARCWRDGDLVALQLTANGFMRQMVRAIVGTVIRVGLGKLSEADFEAIIHAGNRASAGDTAPACGLYLLDVAYPSSDQTHDHPAGGALCPRLMPSLHEEKE